MQHAHLKELRKLKDAPPVVLYCPVDGGPLDPEGLAPLAGVARCVAYTAFGRAQTEAAVAAQRAKDPSFDFPAVEVIPHGVDTDTFRPLEGAEGVAEALERLYADRGFLAEMSERADRNATREEYRWENIAARWYSSRRPRVRRAPCAAVKMRLG